MIISKFHVVRPQFQYAQPDLIDWIFKRDQDPRTLKKKELIFQKIQGVQAIRSRGSVIADLFNPSDQMIYHPQFGIKGADTEKRLELFDQAAHRAFSTIYTQQLLPDHLIHVTCTGYIAPSAAQRVAASTPTTTVTHAYHMGCYGAFPAWRIGQGFISGGKTCDVVHTEFCSLHFDPSADTVEQLMIFSLFGDGAIGYSLSQHGPGLKVAAMHERIIAQTEDMMTWAPSSFGMKMTISKLVPASISKMIFQVLNELLAKVSLEYEQIKDQAIFAIHPGGPKIIEFLAQHLTLRTDQYQHSLLILQQYGNMSSATIPHILEAIAADLSVQPNTPIIAMAFGPGLTISTAYLEKLC